MGKELENAIDTLKKVYEKHVYLDDASIGWEELGELISDTLSNIMGNDEFCEYQEKLAKDR